jgi:anthranilate synthase component 1
VLSPDLDTVRERLDEHSRVPVYDTFVSDTLTPVSAYLNLTGGAEQAGFLLESVEQGQQIARYSFLGMEPAGEIIWENDDYTVSGDLSVGNPSSPFELLDEVVRDWSTPTPDPLPDFTGGLVGYVGYETVHYIEPSVPVKSPTEEYSFPDLHLYLVDKLIVFDHVKRTVYVVSHVQDNGDVAESYRKAEKDIEDIEERLRTRQDAPPVRSTSASVSERLQSNFTPEDYEEAVRSIKESIRAGEVFQAVLSQRLSIRDQNHPFNLYRCLRSLNPSPYMFYLDFEEYQLVGSSPEILAQKEGQQVRVRPIAGTRRRGETPREDQELAEELLSDEKERAEHTMLVDLGRNDLGRVSQSGTVEVTEREVIERYSHVMHMVSNVEGELNLDDNVVDVLKATFPAGTVTGAPKVRAMQIIENLEPDRRGPYAGAVGYISFQRNMDTCIVIRTIARENDQLHIQAGAGVVADSEPAREYEETREKARALVQTVEELEEKSFI